MLEYVLPQLYPYKIITSSIVSAQKFECEIRIALNSEEELTNWKKDFERNTNSKWIVFRSKSAEKSNLLLNRKYLCRHSSHRKRKGSLEDKNCSASILVHLKKNTKFIRHRDPLAKEGYFGIIKINFNHSHKINYSKAWNCQPRSDETKEIFLVLFNPVNSSLTSDQHTDKNKNLNQLKNNMENLLPSEIARLILGYLKETKCEKSWQIFLEECPDLHEYNLLYKRGKLYSTNVNGKSLLNIFNEYCTLKNISENISSVVEFSKEKDVLEKCVRNAVEQVILKYLPSFSRNNTMDNLPADLAQEGHMPDHNLDRSLELENEIEKMDQSNNSIILQENDSKENHDSSGSSVQSKSEDCDIDSSTEEIINSKYSRTLDGLDDNLQSVEQSVPDKIYMLDAIKVEKDNEECHFLKHKSVDDCSKSKELNSRKPSNGSENMLQLHLTENKSVAEESSNKVVSTTSNQKHSSAEPCEAVQTTNGCSLSGLMQTIKVEPDSSVNSIDQTKVSNHSHSNSGITPAVGNHSNLVETYEPAFFSIQSTRGSVNNTPTDSINLVQSQPGYAIHPFASQPLAVSNMSYSPLTTYFVQNCPSNSSLLPNNPQYFQNCSSNSSLLPSNSQYSFIINAPATGTAASLPVAISGIVPNNTGPTVTSVTSLSNQNLPPVLSNNNSLPNINAADSTNFCGTSQTDSPVVIKSVCNSGGTSQTDSSVVIKSVCNSTKAVLVSSAGKNNESKLLTRKSGEITEKFSRKKSKRSCTAVKKNYCEF